MAVIKPQLTDIKFNLHREPKIKAGRQNVPINVPIPLASIAVSTLNLQVFKIINKSESRALKLK